MPAKLHFLYQIFIYLWSLYKTKISLNENDKEKKTLVVAAECDTMANAESICVMLKNNEIEAITVDKESPIYNKADKNISQAQVQVCNKDLKKAKELIG